MFLWLSLKGNESLGRKETDSFWVGLHETFLSV